MATATADPNQRRLMLLLPLVFVVILYRYPAGLLVYWITTNLWTIGQQYFIRRRIGPAAARKAATPVQGSAERQAPTASPSRPSRRWPAPAGRERLGGASGAAAAARRARRRSARVGGDERRGSDEPSDDRDWRAGEELEPAETLEELLEEIADGLGLDAEVEVEEADGVLTRPPARARMSACSSAAAARRSTPSSTWRSGSSSARAPRRCAW